MSNKKNTLALFVDLDNIHIKYVHKLIEELEKDARIVARKGYSNFHNKANGDDFFCKCCLELHHVISGPSFTDAQMMIDVVDFANKNPHVDQYCIVSGDGIFALACQYLQRMGKYVICAVCKEEQMSKKLAHSCNMMITIVK